MAVRLALGETELVKENKEYFEAEGIDLGALESATGKGSGKGAETRSNTVILVKNLPYTTEATELAKRFGAFGDVGGSLALLRASWPSLLAITLGHHEPLAPAIILYCLGHLTSCNAIPSHVIPYRLG